jgi:hypothetical protein
MTTMNDRAGTATQDRPSTMNEGMSPMTQAGMTTGAGVTGWGMGASQGGTMGAAAGSTVGAAGGGVIGWGVGMAGGCVIGLIAGMFLGLAIANTPRR